MRLNALGQVSEVVVKAWDIFQKKEITGKADTGKIKKGGGKNLGATLAEKFGKAKAYVTNYPVKDQSQANALAEALINGKASQFLTGSARCIGNPKLQPGAQAKLSKLGDYDGTYYVVAARHIIGPKGYITDFDFCSSTDGAG